MSGKIGIGAKSTVNPGIFIIFVLLKETNMNTRNDWENLLRYANEDLAKTGFSLLITKDDEGYYSCEIRRDGELVEVYAENYWEDELSDLITDACHYVVLTLWHDGHL